MATDDWNPEDSLAGLNEHPYRYDFFAAVRLFDCCTRQEERTGWTSRPSHERLRLRQRPAMTFAPSAVHSVQWSPHGQHWQMDCRFLGLFGPHGPLPTELTEYVLDRKRDYRDETFVEFVNHFQHRFLGFFYRAYARTEPTIHFDRPDQDRFATYIGSLAGIGSDSFRNRDAMPDLAKLHYIGHLSQQNRYADGLQRMLSDYFEIPVQLHQFVGTWLTIPTENRLFLGRSRQTGTLGQSATIGERIWECTQSIRVEVGPVSLQDYEAFLPSGRYLPQLRALIENYAGLVVDWTVQLVVRREEVPPTRLGVAGQLGWKSWLVREAPAEDARDLVLAPRQGAVGRLW